MFKQFFRKIFQAWPIKILAFVIAILLFLFHSLSAFHVRYFTVPVEVLLNEEMVPIGDVSRQVQIVLRGPESIYSLQEEDVYVYVDLREKNQEGMYRAPIKINKQGQAKIIAPLEVTTKPKNLTLTLEKKFVKSLKVEADIQGMPARGYELVRSYLVPSVVTVSGPSSVVRSLKRIQTETITISGIRENIIERISLKRPHNSISFPEGGRVEFHGIVQEAIIIKSFEDINVILRDIGPGLEVVSTRVLGRLKLQGPKVIMSSLEKEDLRLEVDCSNIKNPGRYTLMVKPVVPEEILVLQYSPVHLDLEFKGIDTLDWGNEL